MCDIALQIPTMRHTPAVRILKEDYLLHGEYPEELFPTATEKAYSRWLGDSYRNSRESTANENWVPTTTLFAVRKDDNKIIGITDIRHNLEQDVLKEYGGHIGYSVCPTERCKGYGTTILQLALDYTREMGLERVMLSCNEENIASVRVIEKCGGILQSTKVIRDERIRIYWIGM